MFAYMKCSRILQILRIREHFMHTNICSLFPATYPKIREIFMHANFLTVKFAKFSCFEIFMFYSSCAYRWPVRKQTYMEGHIPKARKESNAITLWNPFTTNIHNSDSERWKNTFKEKDLVSLSWLLWSTMAIKWQGTPLNYTKPRKTKN